MVTCCKCGNKNVQPLDDSSVRCGGYYLGSGGCNCLLCAFLPWGLACFSVLCLIPSSTGRGGPILNPRQREGPLPKGGTSSHRVREYKSGMRRQEERRLEKERKNKKSKYFSGLFRAGFWLLVVALLQQIDSIV